MHDGVSIKINLIWFYMASMEKDLTDKKLGNAK